MTNNEIQFRAELMALLKKHSVRLKKDDVYYPGESERPCFIVPPDKPDGYRTEITIDDVADWLGGWE